jgi:hypothetical protein
MRRPLTNSGYDSIWMNMAVTASAMIPVATQPKIFSRRVTTNLPIIFGLDALRIMTTMIGAEIIPITAA